jgi:hypothetical protein
MFENSRNRAGAKWHEQSMLSAMDLGNRTFIQVWAFDVFDETISNAEPVLRFGLFFAQSGVASHFSRPAITTRSANC